MQVGEKGVSFPQYFKPKHTLPWGFHKTPLQQHIVEQSDLLSVIAGRNPNQMQPRTTHWNSPYIFKKTLKTSLFYKQKCL